MEYCQKWEARSLADQWMKRYYDAIVTDASKGCSSTIMVFKKIDDLNKVRVRLTQDGYITVQVGYDLVVSW
ncbi:MAG: hypothetical protein JNK10_09005 [Cyclobacteriaceae bacterium]|nr:hypothetical protein [Cyclobacteriaceae bacterium]